MIYNGEFRNNDTSIDSNGQLYKVVIDTSIRDSGAYSWVEDIIHPGSLHPQTPKTVQLADDPFIVEYEGESNIYKPYKCSTATVRIMLDRFERDLMCTKKNDILVMLLKWKNNVKRSVDANLRPIMINSETGEILNQRTVALGGGSFWTGYDPREYDEFCYDVEWIGYTTPNTFSQNYTNIVEPFELECQDALSTLKYFDYNAGFPRESRTFFGTLVNCLKQLDGVYKHIYVTDSIKVKPADSRHALDKLTCLDGNWYDEDGRADSSLDVIFNMLQYINCTICAYRDDLYIINYDAIASEQRIYKRYTRSDQDQIIIDQNIGFDYIPDGKMYIGSRFDIDGLKLAGSDTQISTTSTYKKVEMNTDEYYADSIIPDISDDEQVEVTSKEFAGHIITGDFDSNKLVEEMYEHKNDKYTSRTRVIKYAGKMLKQNDNKEYGSIETIYYDKDYKVGNGAVDFHTTPKPNYQLVEFAETFSTLGCSLMEYGSFMLPTDVQGTLADIFQGYNGNRVFYFHTPSLFKREVYDNWPGDASELFQYPQSMMFGNQPIIKQPMLKITTKKCFMKAYRENQGGQFINIKGDWTFYNTTPECFPAKAGWSTDVNDKLLARAECMYTWVKLYVTDSNGNRKWCYSEPAVTGSNYTYGWQDTECWCKLFYGGAGYNNISMVKGGRLLAKSHVLCADSDAFENEFSIIKNNSGVDGTVIPIPEINNSDFYGTVTIEFNRPVGCGGEINGSIGMYYSRCSTLSNFDLNIVDYSDTLYYSDGGADESNGEYEVKMNDYAVDDFPSISSKLSSGFKKSTNLSSVYVNNNGINSRVDCISNNGCGLTSIPEKIVVNNIANTYKEPKLLLDMTLHLKYVMNYILDTYTWSTQFKGVQFVANSIVVDYCNDILKVKLFEKPTILPQDASYTDITRNIRRNGDNLFNPIPRKTVTVVTDQNQPAVIIRPQITKQNYSLVVDSAGPGLIADSNVEVNFDSGYAQLSYPNNMEITSEIINGELVINY